MKKFFLFFLSLILIFSSVTCLAKSPDKTESTKDVSIIEEAPEFINGIYVTCVFHLDYPSTPTTNSAILQSDIDNIINNCKLLGFNAIFLQVRPCADAIYPSAIFPTSMYLTGNQNLVPDHHFDPLAYFIAKAHESNMQLHAWINPYRVTRKPSDYNQLSPISPAKQHPEWLVLYNDGNYYFDPAIPEVQSLILQGVTELLTNYDIDGIHMDDYFYPGIDFNDNASFVKYNPNNIIDKYEWRRQNVTNLVQSMAALVHGYNPSLLFGISPSGVWENASSNPLGSNTRGGNPSYSKHYADTRKWALEGYIDYISPQIYWENGNTFCDYKTLLDWWNTTTFDSPTRLFISMADYRANEVGKNNPWFNGVELNRQLKQNKELPKITGQIHYRYQSIMANPALQEVIINSY